MGNSKLKKSLVVKWLKRLVLMLLAFLTFTNSRLLTRQTIAIKPAPAAQQLTQKGEQLYQQGKFDAAAIAWERSAKIYQQLGDQENQTLNLINTSEALQANGRYLKACNTILQALDVDRFDCRSLTEQNNGDHRDLAFHSWFKTASAQPNNLTQVTGWQSLGDILQQLGRLDLSTKVLQQALQNARQLSATESAARILVRVIINKFWEKGRKY